VSQNVKGNIWKLFVAEFTQRRYFFPILSIYFLTLPDANAQQIGLWTGIGFLAEFLFEIPSGYLSDRIGHKKMLVISKLLLIFSVISFIIGGSLPFFILGAVLISLSFAAESGTKTAFLHETLISLGQGKQLVATGSRIFANARLVSSFLIFLIPLGAQISLKTPLYFSLALDIIGLIAVVWLVNPAAIKSLKPKKSVITILRDMRGRGFYPIVIFTSAISGFSLAQMSYLFPYLDSLGFPIALLGIIGGLRSIGAFLIGHKIIKFENKINIKRIFIFDLLLFSSSFVLIGFFNNLIIITIILVIVGGYDIGRSAFIGGYLARHYVRDKDYMATTLSIKGQTNMLFNFIVAFGIGFIMNYSYQLGFYAMGGVLFLILLTTLFFVKNRQTV